MPGHAEQAHGATTLCAPLLGVLVTLAACKPATPPPEKAPPTSVTQPATDARVELVPDGDALRARFTLPEPVTALSFAAVDHVRRDAWSMVTAQLELRGEGIEGEAPFDRFELLLRPDPREHDRVYPAVTRIGTGHAVYGPALVVAGMDTSASLRVDDETVVIPPPDALEGYVYVGPPDAVVERAGVTLVGTGTVAPWLGDAIATEATDSLSYYTTRLGRPVRTPTIFVSGQSPGPMGFHGDVTPNSVIFVRFHGDRWATPDGGATERVAKFVRHEAFHLWNGNNCADAPPWVHEGGAEYAAIVAAVHAGVSTQQRGLEEIGSHVTRCRRALGDGSFSEVPPHGSLVYNCGVTLQWVADVEARARSNGTSNVFTLWRTLLEGTDGSPCYTVDDLRRHTGPMVAMLLDDEVDARWEQLREELERAGVVVSEAPNDADFRSATMNHLLGQACGDGPRGYWTESGFLRLDTGDHCGPLSDGPEVVGAEGRSLFGESAQVFESVRARCEAEQDVRVRLRTGGEVSVPCRGSPSRPVVFNVASAPPLAVE